VSEAADELVRDAERVADRLQVVGPRMAARSGPDAEQVLAGVRALLSRLADLAADAEGLPRRELPVLAPHALADQLLVLAHDLARTGDAAALGSGRALLGDLKRRI
jgi:hypothetical protein